MAQLTFAATLIQSLQFIKDTPAQDLQDFVDLQMLVPAAGGANDANMETLLNSNGGFPGNTRQIAWSNNANVFDMNGVSIKKNTDGSWLVHCQTALNPASAIYDEFKEFLEDFGEQNTDNFYVDDGA